jgi:hypothetical protein
MVACSTLGCRNHSISSYYILFWAIFVTYSGDTTIITSDRTDNRCDLNSFIVFKCCNTQIKYSLHSLSLITICVVIVKYGLIPLTRMSRQKNSEEGYGVLQQQVSTVSSKNYWYCCRSRIGSFWGFNFLTYVTFHLSVTCNRKCRCSLAVFAMDFALFTFILESSFVCLFQLGPWTWLYSLPHM